MAIISVDELEKGIQSKSNIVSIEELEKSYKPQDEGSISTQGLGYVKEHPFKTVFEDVVKTTTGKGISQRVDESVGGVNPFVQNFDQFGDNTIAKAEAFGRSYVTGLAGDVASAVTTPANYLIPPAVKGVAKVASKVPGLAKGAATKLITSMIKPKYSYGKTPESVGLTVAKTVKSAKDLPDLLNQVSGSAKETGNKIGQAIKDFDAKSGQVTTVDITGALKPIDKAMAKAAETNNKALLDRLVDAKKAIENKLVAGKDINGQDVIQNAGIIDLKNMKAQEAFDLKSKIDSMTKWTGNMSDDGVVNKALQDSYRVVRSTLNTKIPELKPLNNDYGNLLTAKSAIQKRIGQEANKSITAGDVVGTIASLGINKVLDSVPVRTRLANVLAGMAKEESAKVISKYPQLKPFVKTNLKNNKGQLNIESNSSEIKNFERTNINNNKGMIENTGKSDYKKIYHGTDKVFNDFDLSKTADGTVWFTDNKNLINKGEVGASGKGNIVERYINEKKLKLGSWEEQDKYSTDELINMGYDGLKLKGDKETTYQVFNPDKLKKFLLAVGTAGALASTNPAEASTLGQKNNNPINLKAFEKWDGMTGKDKYGHAIFKNLDYGIRAGYKNIKNHVNKNPNETLVEYFNKFAEENGTKEAEYIAKKLKISPKTKIGKINPHNILKHAAYFESKTKLSDSKIHSIIKGFNL